MLPLWLRILWPCIVCFIFVVNWRAYGPANYLWFSDIGLLMTAVAVIFQSSFFASMAAISVAALEVAWNAEFLLRLMHVLHGFGLTDYMFNSQHPLIIRIISLFHVPLPFLMVWLVHRLGYDWRALPVQTTLAWIVLPLTYFFTKRSDNINWVFGWGRHPQDLMPPWAHLLLMMVLFPLVVYLPSHFVLERWFAPRGH